MTIIEKENRESANKIISELRFLASAKCKKELDALAHTISIEQLKNGKTYYILEFGKIRSDKPKAYYFTHGEFNKELSTSEKLIFRVPTGLGDRNYEYKRESLLLLD